MTKNKRRGGGGGTNFPKGGTTPSKPKPRPPSGGTNFPDGLGPSAGTNFPNGLPNPATPTPTTPTPAPVTPTPTPPPVQMSAFAWLTQLLQQYGLESLGSHLEGWIRDGITDASELELKLAETQEWKTRFAGNERLRAAGVPVLSVAEYLAVERSYAQVMKNYGLPLGFYDDPSDFAGFIGGSVSASELQTRVQMYSDVAKREDPAIIAQLQSMGMSAGDIMAHFMDPERALPLLQRKYQQALIGGAARRAGIIPDNDYAAHLADLGVTEREAMQGYGTVGGLTKNFTTLGAIYGDDYDVMDAQQEVFESNPDASRKRKRLASHERGAWSGQSGTDRDTFTRITGGAY